MPARSWAVAAAGGALVASLAGAPTATAAPRNDFVDRGFVFRLGAAAAQAEADIPRAIPTSLGYSQVRLAKDVLDPHAQCRSAGAGLHLTENGVLENNGPSGTGDRRTATYPIEARDRAPNLSPGEWYSRRPQPVPYLRHQLRDVGLGEERLPWAAHCAGDSAGTAAGNILAASTGAAGSTTTGRLDKWTGTYVGTSRAFVAGLTTPSGTVAALASTVTVTHRAGKAPVLDYRIAVNDGTLAAGSSVPADQLTRQFNEQVRDNAAALAAIGEFGLTLAGPTTSTSADLDRRVVHFPFVEVSAGVPAGEGGIGQGQRVRLLAVAYEGSHQGPVGRLG